MVFKNLRRQFLPLASLNSKFLMGMKLVVSYFMFWLVFFILFRGIFLLYHSQLSAELSPTLITGAFYHGLKMDISFSSYLSLLVFTVLGLSYFFSVKTTAKIITVITLLFLSLISIISVADLELFKEWGFRLDATPLSYLATPREMAASVSSSPYLLLIASIVITVMVGFRVYKKYIYKRLLKLSRPGLLLSLIYLVLAGLMIIPIRGGLQLAPMNQSVAFFSSNDFANQAAINVPWNFFWSLGKELYSRNNPYQFMPEPEAEQLVREYYASSNQPPVRLLNTSRPNVIIILWESLTSKVVPAIGGDILNVIPEFTALTREGILFTNFYANGNRSDKGMVALLSGYPAQPNKSIVKIPTKSSRLPVITGILNQNGYYTSYYHGGELAFANIKSYLVNAKFNTLVGKDSFKSGELNSKWGAHDHIVLDRALREISRQPLPFFTMIFTLSSHEPFDIPTEPRFPGEDLESMYKSSLYYTDQSVGNFIRQAKQQPWYKNTLVIILSDHGHRLLGDSPRYEKERFHIPMLWLGGALAVRDSIVTKTCSQTDVARTLLNQLDLDSEAFSWSKDIFDSTSASGAFYVYIDGIGLVNGEEQLIYDHPGRTFLQRTRNITEKEVKLTKAHLQYAYQDYLNK